MATFEQAIAEGLIRPAVLVFIDATTPIRTWFGGFGPKVVPADGVDAAGGTYQGLGWLVGMPALSQLINGVAERVDFTLSGVPAEVIALADADAASIRGAPVHVGLYMLGSDWQAYAPVEWLWEGEADVAKISRTASIDEQGNQQIVRTVGLSVGTAFTGRRRPKATYWTHAHQSEFSPGDLFCVRTPIYAQGKSLKWS